jgi:hypothetical protein
VAASSIEYLAIFFQIFFFCVWGSSSDAVMDPSEAEDLSFAHLALEEPKVYEQGHV